MSQRELGCEQALQHLFEFIDHELDAEERDAVQHHLFTCRSCYSRAEFERRLKLKLHELQHEKPVAQASERIKRLLQAF